MLAFSMRKFFWGLIFVAVGGLLWADNLGLIVLSFHFSRDWPIFIVAIGLMSIWDAMFGRHWWAHKFCGERKGGAKDFGKVLEDLEKGNITAEEAVRRMGGK